LELHGHTDRLVGITFDKLRKTLITCSADGHLGVWPMNVKRNETPKWLESDACQMWTQKQIGIRQVRRFRFSFERRLNLFFLLSIIVENVVELYVMDAHKHERYFL
jgi:WD40 repeat protein